MSLTFCMAMDPAGKHLSSGGARREWRLPDACAQSIQQLFTECGAERWQLSRASLHAALTRSAAKRFGESPAPVQKIREYFATLHVQDLALACACAEGSEPAWNHFVGEYRGYLRAAAAAILRCPATEPAAIELADSLFADLYGLTGGKAGGRSLFRYFHGRSSLKTWLRAILAQRNIDSIRAGKRFEELAEEETGDGPSRTSPGSPEQPDPHRERYLACFTRALHTALDRLAPQEKERLRL